MKISLFTSGFRPLLDGVTIAVYERLRRLSAWGHQVQVLCPDYSVVPHHYSDWERYTGEMLPGVQVVNLPSVPFFGMDFERNVAFGSYRQALAALRAFEPDVVHVDEPERMYAGFGRRPGLAYARKAGIPCTAHYHTNYVDYGEDYLGMLPPWALAALTSVVGRVFGLAFNPYDMTMVASPSAQERVRRLGVTNTRLIDTLGVDTGLFHPDHRRPGYFADAYGLPEVDDKIKLAFVGRLAPDKGWDFTVKALPELAQAVEMDRVALLIAGSGADRAIIEERLRPLVPHLHFLGRLPPEGVAALFANADVHVTASEKETRGLTVLEALACGIPVVGPKAGAIPDAVRDGENGFVYPARDVGAFVSRMKAMIDDAALRRRMGKAGRESVAHLDWDDCVGNWLAALEHLVDRNRTARTRRSPLPSASPRG